MSLSYKRFMNPHDRKIASHMALSVYISDEMLLNEWKKPQHISLIAMFGRHIILLVSINAMKLGRLIRATFNLMDTY